MDDSFFVVGRMSFAGRNTLDSPGNSQGSLKVCVKSPEIVPDRRRFQILGGSFPEF